jgi:hypothetical protein
MNRIEKLSTIVSKQQAFVRIRYVLIAILGVASLIVGKNNIAYAQALQASANTSVPIQPASREPVQLVSPDTLVITIHGFCATDAPPIGHKADACTVVITRSEFDAMISAINITDQQYSPAALRSLASDFITIMALAESGEKADIAKTPSVQQLLRVARTRALADAYRRFLRDVSSAPSPKDIEEYYNQNLKRFEQVRIERIFVPKVNPKHAQDKPAEFEKKAQLLAEEIRERAARGEDVGSLQADVYKMLALDVMPPQTDLNEMQRNGLTAAVQNDIEELKPGQVTKVQRDTSGFNIYKLRARHTLTLEEAKRQIVRELSEKNFDAALKKSVSSVQPEFSDQFFRADQGVKPSAHAPTRTQSGMPAAGNSAQSN